MFASPRPTGTVSFLFTDIERSTQLWDRVPEAMTHALEQHDAILNHAISAAGGAVFATGGDGFCVAFDAARNAVAAAIDAQRQLSTHAWPDDCVLRVRMGVHTGEAVERAGDYFGPAVNLAARVMSAAHGGQIVCTDIVAELVAGKARTRSLGEQELRGVSAVVGVHQVMADGLPDQFPPLRTLVSVRTNLPHELSTSVGRGGLIARTVELVVEERLVTLTGIGGVGKTTVALNAGRDLLSTLKQGVWLVELSGVTRPELILDVIAAAIRFTAPSGVPIRDALTEYLDRRELLLVLDNCEQIVDGVAEEVRWLLSNCALLRILATSREALGAPGERVLAVPPLAVPTQDSLTGVLGAPSGELFVARAVEAGANWRLDEANAPAVARLCRLLDGVPLALGLAAARSAQLSVQTITSRLGAHLDVLSSRRSGEARHRSLMAALEWSYELLEAHEQDLFQQLAVFVEGFDVDGVLAVAAAADVEEWQALDALSSLVAKSLVERDPMRTGRYRLLETVRVFAAAQAKGDGAARAHAQHYMRVLGDAFHQLRRTDGVEATERLVAEAGNVEAALHWAAASGHTQQALPIFEVPPPLSLMALPAKVTESLGRSLERLLYAAGAHELPGYSAACAAASWIAVDSSDSNHISRVFAASQRAPADSYTALCEASICGGTGDMAQGASAMHTALDRLDDAADPLVRAGLLACLAIFDAFSDPPAALSAAQDSIALARTHGGPLAQLHPLLALTLCTQSEPRTAAAVAFEAARLDRTVRRPFSSIAIMLAAHAAAGVGDLASAVPLLRRSIAHIARAGSRFVLCITIGTAADAIATTAPTKALQLTCLAESGAINRVSILENVSYTNLRQLAAQTDLAELDLMRSRFADLSYDDAVAFALATLDDIAQQVSHD